MPIRLRYLAMSTVISLPHCHLAMPPCHSRTRSENPLIPLDCRIKPGNDKKDWLAMTKRLVGNFPRSFCTRANLNMPMPPSLQNQYISPKLTYGSIIYMLLYQNLRPIQWPMASQQLTYLAYSSNLFHHRK
jgi:hypothetical protein